jgi:hypothetical protein
VPERIVDDGSTPFASDGGVNHRRGPFAAVGDRRLDRLNAFDAPHTCREQRRRFER